MQRHQLDHMQTTDQHLITQFLQTRYSSWRPTNSEKVLKANHQVCKRIDGIRSEMRVLRTLSGCTAGFRHHFLSQSTQSVSNLLTTLFLHDVGRARSQRLRSIYTNGRVSVQLHTSAVNATLLAVAAGRNSLLCVRRAAGCVAFCCGVINCSELPNFRK